MSGKADLRRLPNDPVFPLVDARQVGGYVHGRQYGIDSVRFGKPYVFSRISESAVWVIWAGPFVDETAAEAWIECLA